MNHLTAAQKGEGGGWHYVSMSRRGGHPLGYCADHAPHATADEARACFRRYERDHVVLNAMQLSWTSCSVKGCDRPARAAADIEGNGYQLAPLCAEHMTLEHAITALGLNGDLAGDSWQS